MNDLQIVLFRDTGIVAIEQLQDLAFGDGVVASASTCITRMLACSTMSWNARE